jgi:hypothetical protein
MPSDAPVFITQQNKSNQINMSDTSNLSRKSHVADLNSLKCDTSTHTCDGYLHTEAAIRNITPADE